MLFTWQSMGQSQASTSHHNYIQNILNCVPKTNNVFMELERHAGEEVNNDKIIILGLSIPLSGINHNLFQKDVRLIRYFFID